jgi:hypothetical protein
MNPVTSRILIAVTTFFLASGAFAGDIEDQAAVSGLSFPSLEFQFEEVSGAIPSPSAPAEVRAKDLGPYYPGINERSPESGGPVSNFGLVVDGVYRGARISKEEQFKFLKDAGVSTLVNVSWPARDDKDLCEKYGFDCSYKAVKIIPGADLYFGMKDLKGAFGFTVDELKAGRKVYIHCHFGRERTGILAAALMIRQNMCEPSRQGEPQLKEKTWDLVEASLKKFGYKMTYQKPFEEMKSWITDFEGNKAWLCR